MISKKDFIFFTTLFIWGIIVALTKQDFVNFIFLGLLVVLALLKNTIPKFRDWLETDLK